jgi:hypothetical protein
VRIPLEEKRSQLSFEAEDDLRDDRRRDIHFQRRSQLPTRCIGPKTDILRNKPPGLAIFLVMGTSAISP